MKIANKIFLILILFFVSCKNDTKRTSDTKTIYFNNSNHCISNINLFFNDNKEHVSSEYDSINCTKYLYNYLTEINFFFSKTQSPLAIKLELYPIQKKIDFSFKKIDLNTYSFNLFQYTQASTYDIDSLIIKNKDNIYYLDNAYHITKYSHDEKQTCPYIINGSDTTFELINLEKEKCINNF